MLPFSCTRQKVKSLFNLVVQKIITKVQKCHLERWKRKKICNKCRRSEKSHSSPVAAQVQTLEGAIEKFWGVKAFSLRFKISSSCLAIFRKNSNSCLEDFRGWTWSVDLPKTIIYPNFDSIDISRARKLKINNLKRSKLSWSIQTLSLTRVTGQDERSVVLT